MSLQIILLEVFRSPLGAALGHIYLVVFYCVRVWQEIECMPLGCLGRQKYTYYFSKWLHGAPSMKSIFYINCLLLQ